MKTKEQLETELNNLLEEIRTAKLHIAMCTYNEIETVLQLEPQYGYEYFPDMRLTEVGGYYDAGGSHEVIEVGPYFNLILGEERRQWEANNPDKVKNIDTEAAY